MKDALEWGIVLAGAAVFALWIIGSIAYLGYSLFHLFDVVA